MNTIEKAIEKLGKGSQTDNVSSQEKESDVESRLPDIEVAQACYDQGVVAEIAATLRENRMLNPHTPELKLVEEYRKIKRPILMNIASSSSAKDKKSNANLVMVSSSLPGEGKTFTSINLAVSIAMELDKTVLLVDADVHKPATSMMLGVVDRYGLTDLLATRNLDLSQVLIKTDIPKVSLLSVGCKRDNSNELLASQSMSDLMSELAHRYHDRVIIIDTPPLLATNEASLVANLVGQIIVVVEAEKTSPSILEEGLSQFEHENKSIGLVLNKARISSSENKYYYGNYSYVKGA